VRVEGFSAKSRILRCAQNLGILEHRFAQTLCQPEIQIMCGAVSPSVSEAVLPQAGRAFAGRAGAGE